MEKEMRTLCIEGPATHDDPAHALAARKGATKRWRGAVQAG